MATDTIDKAVIHILTTFGFIKDSELIEHIDYIKDDFKEVSDLSIPTIFRSINAKLRKFSFEVRSVHLTNSNNARVTYHGIVNTEEDHVAKDFGASFSAADVKYFAQVAMKLLEEHSLSTHEVFDLHPYAQKVNEAKRRENSYTREIEATIARLESHGWFRRNDSNYIVLGARAHLELRSYFESVIMDSEDLEAMDAAEKAERTAHLKSLIADMPQIIVY